tara:strand:- start:265 stop:777 length:513 start_codon:yes stop_codon:yes gene_type:complete
MPKHIIKKILSNSKILNKFRNMRILSSFLKDPYLLHLNRKSVSGAFAVGLFWAMIPIPIQMIAAAITAVGVRVNLPLAITLVWISNPLTMAPIFYFNYLVGTWTIGVDSDISKFEPNLNWIMTQLETIWVPLYFGSFLVGLVVGILGYFSVRVYWRWYIIRKLKKRTPRN